MSRPPSRKSDPNCRRAAEAAGRRRRRHHGTAAVLRRDARLLRASRLAARGRLRRALRGYLGLAAERPSDLAVRNRAGDLLVQAGEIARATDLFMAVADGYQEAGFEHKSVAILRKVLRIAPDHAAARRALIRWLQAHGRGVEARRIAAAIRSVRTR